MRPKYFLQVSYNVMLYNGVLVGSRDEFSRRNRALEAGDSPYHVIPETVVLSDSSVTMDLVNKQNDVWFTAKIQALEDNTARIQINEKSPLRPRYEAQDVLVGEPKTER